MTSIRPQPAVRPGIAVSVKDDLRGLSGRPKTLFIPRQPGADWDSPANRHFLAPLWAYFWTSRSSTRSLKDIQAPVRFTSQEGSWISTA